MTLALCLSLTAIASAIAQRLVTAQDRATFNQAADFAERELRERLEIYSAMLLSARGLFATLPDLHPIQFRTYVDHLDWEHRFKGVAGIGYSRWVSAKEVEALLQSMISQGPADFISVTPSPQTASFSVLLYLEPFAQRTTAGLGYDMLDNPVLQAAAERARDRGELAASGRVTLATSRVGEESAGFILYLPLYRSPQAPTTLARRRAELLGYVYCPIRMNEMARSALSASRPVMALRLYEGETITPGALVFDGVPAGSPSPRFTSTRTLELGGHRWTLVVTSLPLLEHESRQALVLLVSVFGAALSIALFLLALTRSRARELVARHMAELAAQQAQLQAVVEQLPAGVVIADAASRQVTLVNTRAQELLGRAPELPTRLDTYPDYRQLLTPMGQTYSAESWPLGRSLGGGEVVNEEEFEVVGPPPQSIVLARASPVRDRSGRIISSVTTLSDITRRKREEQVHRFLTQASKQLTENLDIELTMQRLGKLCVPQLGDLCAVELEESPGKFKQIVFSTGPSEDEEVFLAALKAMPPVAGTVRWEIMQSATPRMIPSLSQERLEQLIPIPGIREQLLGLRIRAAMIVPLRGRLGTLGALTVVSRGARPYDQVDLDLAFDLGLRAGLALENARLYAERDKAVQTRDLFLSATSHDLRNFLAALKMSAARIGHAARGGPREAEMQQRIERMQRSITQMNRLILDLLDVGSIQVGRLRVELQTCDVGSILNEALAVLQDAAVEKRVSLEMVPVDPPVRVVCDRDRILQVLSNLIGNAIKFGREGDHISVRATLGEDEVTFAVEDTGPGVAPELLPHLFEAFWTGRDKKSGTGLGLFIAMGIIEVHGGKIWARSQLGEGTRICFTLPTTPARAKLDDRDRPSEHTPAEPP